MTENPNMPTLTGVVPPPPSHAVGDCDTHGHVYEHIVTAAGEPLKLICARCDRVWTVEEQ